MTARNSAVELLRIFLMPGVIILHYVGGNGELLSIVDRSSMHYYIIVLMNTIGLCAVDTFIIISGYYGCKSFQISTKKVIQLIVEVVIFQLLLSIGVNVLKGNIVTISSIVFNLIPRNYYVTLYVSLILLTPFINLFIKSKAKQTLKSL